MTVIDAIAVILLFALGTVLGIRSIGYMSSGKHSHVAVAVATMLFIIRIAIVRAASAGGSVSLPEIRIDWIREVLADDSMFLIFSAILTSAWTWYLIATAQIKIKLIKLKARFLEERKQENVRRKPVE